MQKLIVSSSLLDFFESHHIYQARYNVSHDGTSEYVARFKVGDSLIFSHDTLIEEFSTFGSGHVLFSAGAFSSLMSSMPAGTVVGRYTCLAIGLKKVGFRHPVEAVGMNSALFNFNRENVHSYFHRYEATNGSVPREAVPKPQPQLQPIKVGNDVWIGSNVTLFGGITIGDGAVIASGSTVTKDVEPYSLVAGVPAIHKKWRFPEEVRERLISSSWWDYELGDMYREGLDFSDPIKFVEEFEYKKHNIRKMNIKKISLYSFELFGNNYSLFENKNLLLDHMDRLLCIENNSGHLVLVKKDSKAVIDDNVFPVMIKKTIDQYALYVENKGYIEIKSDFSVILYENPSEVMFTKLSLHKQTLSVNLKSGNLCSNKNNDFSLKPHIRAWEIFKISLPLN